MNDATFLELKHRYYREFKTKEENWKGRSSTDIEQAALRWGYEMAVSDARRRISALFFGAKEPGR